MSTFADSALKAYTSLSENDRAEREAARRQEQHDLGQKDKSLRLREFVNEADRDRERFGQEQTEWGWKGEEFGEKKNEWMRKAESHKQDMEKGDLDIETGQEELTQSRAEFGEWKDFAPFRRQVASAEAQLKALSVRDKQADMAHQAYQRRSAQRTERASTLADTLATVEQLRHSDPAKAMEMLQALEKQGGVSLQREQEMNPEIFMGSLTNLAQGKISPDDPAAQQALSTLFEPTMWTSARAERFDIDGLEPSPNTPAGQPTQYIPMLRDKKTGERYPATALMSSLDKDPVVGLTVEEMASAATQRLHMNKTIVGTLQAAAGQRGLVYDPKEGAVMTPKEYKEVKKEKITDKKDSLAIRKSELEVAALEDKAKGGGGDGDLAAAYKDDEHKLAAYSVARKAGLPDEAIPGVVEKAAKAAKAGDENVAITAAREADKVSRELGDQRDMQKQRNAFRQNVDPRNRIPDETVDKFIKETKGADRETVRKEVDKMRLEHMPDTIDFEKRGKLEDAAKAYEATKDKGAEKYLRNLLKGEGDPTTPAQRMAIRKTLGE